MSSRKPGDEYDLPTPDMSVFGEQDETAAAAQAATAQPPQPEAPAEPETEQRPGPRRRGRMTFQNAGVPKHEPSLAEQRARQQAAAETEAEAEAELERAYRKRRTRKRLLIGGVVVVIAGAIIGSQFLSNQTTTANCVGADQNDQGAVVSDQYCDEAYVTNHGGHVANGIIFLPLSGGGFQQYRYYYGGSISSGHVSGGSYSPPGSGTIKTGSGKTVTRGGFGVPSGSGGSGGKSGSGGSGGKSGSGGRSGGGKHH